MVAPTVDEIAMVFQRNRAWLSRASKEYIGARDKVTRTQAIQVVRELHEDHHRLLQLTQEISEGLPWGVIARPRL